MTETTLEESLGTLRKITALKEGGAPDCTSPGGLGVLSSRADARRAKTANFIDRGLRHTAEGHVHQYVHPETDAFIHTSHAVYDPHGDLIGRFATPDDAKKALLNEVGYQGS